MRGGQSVIPVGRQQQHRLIPEPPAKEPQQVDRGLISPVHILHDQHVQLARLADLPQQRPEQALPRRIGPAQVQQLTAQLGRDIEQRPQRLRSEQAVARPPVPAGVGQILLQLLDQRGLAGARLPGDEHQPAVTASGIGCVLGQRRQLRFTLQQRHQASLHDAGGERYQARRHWGDRSEIWGTPRQN